MSLFEPARTGRRPAERTVEAPAVRPVAAVEVVGRRPVDLDQLQEAVTAVGGFTLYLVGALGGALALGTAFGSWVGFLLLLAAGAVPSGYTLKRNSERRAERERAERYAAAQERTLAPGAVDIPTLP